LHHSLSDDMYRIMIKYLSSLTVLPTREDKRQMCGLCILLRNRLPTIWTRIAILSILLNAAYMKRMMTVQCLYITIKWCAAYSTFINEIIYFVVDCLTVSLKAQGRSKISWRPIIDMIPMCNLLLDSMILYWNTALLVIEGNVEMKRCRPHGVSRLLNAWRHLP